jgi:succinoglycan biosynthesis transport protein ExoP
MDGIQPYVGGARTPAPQYLSTAAPQAHTISPTVVKTPSDYFRALRRKIWLVLAISVPLGVAITVWSVRQPSIYRATAQIFIEPPQYDPVLSTFVAHEVGQRDPDASEKYLPNRVAQLRSKVLAEQVVNDPAFTQVGPPDDEAADMLLKNLQTRLNTGTNYVTVSLEGTDPARASRQLYTLLDLFQKQAKNEIENKNDDTRQFAEDSLNNLKAELRQIDDKVIEILKGTTTIGPSGSNIVQAQYENLGSMLMQKKMRLSEVQQQSWIAQMFPKFNANPEHSARDSDIAQLQAKRRQLHGQLLESKRRIKHFESDPTARALSVKLQQVMDEIEEIRSLPTEKNADPSEMIVASLKEEIHSDEEAVKSLLARLRDSMPEHQKYLALHDERKAKLERIAEMETKISGFKMLSRSQKSPISIPSTIAEPTVPVRPRRSVNIALGLMFSLGLGIGLVCLLEHIDHSVKVPEHLTLGLTLPLCGVVPRIRRTSLIHRGGHLWTPGAPESIEADAYRNLRASLLGVADRRGPIVTLLVTSAKAGEGKSTTALNLAATCARAGERTLLMDVDLRRPSLAEVFATDDHNLGLVDVLRGELPWQRTVVRTDIPNLDFLPTGDTRDVPIEVLGTLELRQLIALSSHYDRVILDGPAILGMADCRMLGRIVDAALLVVRSGTHELRPLQRAKAMLEQSHVVIAGVVFNGLYEDLQNWSSYGPNTPYAFSDGPSGSGRGFAPAAGLDSPQDVDDPNLLVTAGAFEP